MLVVTGTDQWPYGTKGKSRKVYNIRDTFITLALSAGEDPGWVAQVCGTSEEMIFRHYRRWIPGLQPDVGRKVGQLLDRAAGGTNPPPASPSASPIQKPRARSQEDRAVATVEAGGIEPPSEPEDRRDLRWSAVVRCAEFLQVAYGPIAGNDHEMPPDLERFRNAFWTFHRTV